MGNRSGYNIDRYEGLKKIELTDSALLIPVSTEDIISKLKSWYSKMAKKIISERLEYFANLMQLDYANVKINNSKTRWGSCDINRNIKLNFRLVMLPHKILDFVLIHELAHIIEFNHSKDFYKVIATVMPSYKLQQKQLKNYDYLLSLYR